MSIKITNSAIEHWWVAAVVSEERYLVIFKAKYQSTAPIKLYSATSVEEALKTCIKLYIKWDENIYYLQRYTSLTFLKD